MEETVKHKPRKRKPRTKPDQPKEGGIKVGSLTMPISFKEFASNPVAGVAFVCIIGIGYLYMDGKSQFEGMVQGQDSKIKSLEVKVDILNDRLRRADSLMSSAQSKIKTLEDLGKIPTSE